MFKQRKSGLKNWSNHSKGYQPKKDCNFAKIIKSFFIGFLIGIIVLSICIHTGVFSKILPTSSDHQNIDVTVLEEKISGLSELATAEYIYTNATKVKNTKRLLSHDIPVTSNQFIVKYSGKIIAGINVDQIKFEVNDDNIFVKLPSPNILSNEIDQNSFEYLDKDNNIFNPFDPEDVTFFESKQKKLMKKQAIKAGIYKKAIKNAKTSIKNLILDIYPNADISFE